MLKFYIIQFFEWLVFRNVRIKSNALKLIKPVGKLIFSARKAYEY